MPQDLEEYRAKVDPSWESVYNIRKDLVKNFKTASGNPMKFKLLKKFSQEESTDVHIPKFL